MSERGRQAHYKLTSTVMLQLVRTNQSEGKDNGKDKEEGWKSSGSMNLSGSMTRQVRSSTIFHV